MATGETCPRTGIGRPSDAPAGPRTGCASAPQADATQALGPAAGAGAEVTEAFVVTERPPGGETPEGTDVGPGAETATASTRVRILGEVARGGMGAVFRGRDLDLNRELAVKVLLDRHGDRPELVRRFVEEAQICGQLQHPGIVPVYGSGVLADRRPFFAMKLVEGRTLAELLRGHGATGRDLPRLVGIFEQVAQTMAYAHARGVIHRDLKPSNVMVGSFGEVQVMDWGLAKVLAQGPPPPGASQAPAGSLRTVRDGDPDAGTQAGAVVGTPRYMAPEQALGQHSRVDTRADVFSLGAILCEILTGQPLYAGSSHDETLRRAARADLGEALARLDGSDADGELIALAKSCLAPDPDARPRDAAAVAEALARHRRGVEDRLKAAEAARVEAQTRAEEEAKRRVLAAALARESLARADVERKRRRAAIGLAAALVCLVVAGGVTLFWWEARLSRADRLIDRAADLCAEAERAIQPDFTRARAALEQAAEAIAGLPGRRLRGRIVGLRGRIDRGERIAAFVRELGTVRADAMAYNPDGRRRGLEGYARSFRANGLDPAVVGPDQAASALSGYGAAVEVAAALDHWASLNAGTPGGPTAPPPLLALARAIDPDPVRNALRDRFGRWDRADLEQMASRSLAEPRDPYRLLLLATAMKSVGLEDRLAEVLLAGRRRFPGDFWIHLQLGMSSYGWDGAIWAFRRPAEAVRFLTAAVALRPDNPIGHLWLAAALRQDHQLKEAIDEFREAARLDPDFYFAHHALGTALADSGLKDEAAAEFREAIRLDPTYCDPHFHLAWILFAQGKFDEAIAEHREAVRLGPDNPSTHFHLGQPLLERGRVDEAIGEFREALRLDPQYGPVHLPLGLALRKKGDSVGAEDCFRRAVEWNPADGWARACLGHALHDLARYEEAADAQREAIRLAPGRAFGHSGLGDAMLSLGRLPEAADAYREAIRVEPGSPWAHCGLGDALMRQGRFEEAIPPLREAVRLGRGPSWARDYLRRAEAGLLDARFPADPFAR